MNEALRLLDSGEVRVAEPGGGRQLDRQSVAQEGGAAVLPAERHGCHSRRSRRRPMVKNCAPPKFAGWGDNDFRTAGFRAVPGSIVRRSAYIAPNVVLMPSFVNLGAHVGEGTMVDTWATVGSCAQIGKHVHLSGGVGIGGVLEPLQVGPVIIEDDWLRRRPLGSGRRRDRAPRLGALHGRVHFRHHQDRRPRHR